MADSLVVTSKVKEAVKANGLRMSGELPEAINSKLKGLLKDAAERAKSNGRGTVKPQDL